jgi:S-layer homology domain
MGSRLNRLSAVFLFGLFGLSQMVNASIIGVAFDNGNGVPANWNSAVADGTMQNLVDESGFSTNVSLTMAGYFDACVNGVTTAATIPSHPNSLAALNTYCQPQSSSNSIVFSGLDPSRDYRVWAVGLRTSVGPFQQQVNFVGSSKIGILQMADKSQLAVNSSVGSSSQTFSSYALKLRPDDQGRIRLDFVGATDLTYGISIAGKIAGVAIEPAGTVVGSKTWVGGNGHIYAVVEFPAEDWPTAASDLEGALPGYHLVTITSQAEQDFVWQFLVEATGGGWEWWLGGYQDAAIETDPAAGWKWVTGEPWSYTAWRFGEPNNGGGIEDHLAMDGNGWNDEGTALGIIKGYIAELGRFDDVAVAHWAFSFIEKVAAARITAGCGNNNYCPSASVTRAQMAVFLERGIHGSSFIPPPASGNMFLDVAANSFAANFIEQFALDGITAGCGGNKYCPDGTVTRDQMAVFLLRAKHGVGYSPPAATGMFGDVPLNHWAVHWIEQLAREGITGGCGNGNYCPGAAVTRDQMAVFLVRTFGL